MKNISISLSTLALVLSILFVVGYRSANVSEKETSWDVLGYYLPLPATFIYEDALLENPTWIKDINEEKQLTGTLYQISTNDEGEPIYFFLLGMAILYLPFFLIGHGAAYITGFPPDGFSLPYQYAMVFGAMVYTIIGLIYLRKILNHYLPDKITAAVILIVVFATNYSHHLTLKNLETVNVLFMFVCLIIWNTIRWHQDFKIKNLIAIGSFITLMAMVKPSEIMIVFVPLLWGVFSKKTFYEKLNIIKQYRVQFVVAIVCCLLLALPQMTYWFVRTGHLFYDSYKNPGVGLDVFSPYLIQSLFSYKKGWLIYTPVMILAVVGLFHLWINLKTERLALLVYFLIAFYIIISWTEWWYGAGFSNRPLITVYPILAIAMGFLLLKISKSKFWIKTSVVVFVFVAMFFNQFQWWQLRAGILEPYRTTKEYYWASFLATSVTQEDKEKLSLYRDFDGNQTFNDIENYELIKTVSLDFEDSNEENVKTDSTNNKFAKLSPEIEYSKTIEIPYRELTSKDHLWVRVSVDCKLQREDSKKPVVVISMERKNGAYGYTGKEIKEASVTWSNFQFDYLTPPIREGKDKLKVFVWNMEKSNFDMDNLKIEIFEKKN
ncbi:MAG: hypothetical protein P8N07_01465 [Flavobacteriales bacterium]|jgi:hypothetical protein|nr:hypothetical protein [Flavobacteriales bacterium]MDG1174442.1 hypothetical protein [Flavobacteriales bacterium]